MKNRCLNFILSFVPVVLIAVGALSGCGDDKKQSQGEKTFAFEVTDEAGDTTSREITTELATVGEALIAEGLIGGEETSYGFMVKTVNGIAADFDKDGAYWAFYVDGEYATAGVDQTDAESGRTYAFVYTKD